MLMIYLNSNEALKLNDSFKLYLTILSINHEKFKATQGRKTKRRTAQFYKNKKIHVGCNDRANLFKRIWALDFPTSYPNPKHFYIFLNKCLLLCTILGLLQHAYFENKVENKTYIYALRINSTDERKQKHAGNILLLNLLSMQQKCNLKEVGPYDLMPTLEILSLNYKVQFFIFSGLTHKKKLEVMYPSQYDDSLKPIFLYHNHNSEHLIFIKNK